MPLPSEVEPAIADGVIGQAEIVTDVGIVGLTAKDHVSLAALVSGSLSQDGCLAFYHSVVERDGKFPAAWEHMILSELVASLPERADLQERLEVIQKQLGTMQHAQVPTDDESDAPMPAHALVQTSKGPIALDRSGHEVLLRLMAARSNNHEAQAFYRTLIDRGVAFPPEWELLVLREAVRSYPERDDLLLRMAELEEELGFSSDSTAKALRVAFYRAWARFSKTELVDLGTETDRRTRLGIAFDDACSLLASPVFSGQPVSRRAEIILALHNTLMSVPSPDLPVIAELGMRRFREMLTDPALTEPQACMVFDCLHSLYFAGISDTQELRRFDTLVRPFEAWLEARHGHHVRPAALPAEDRLTIAYLLHTGHSQRGNAVTPLVISLAKMHSARSNRRILVYLVQYVAPEFVESLEAQGIEVRAFDQGQRYDRIDDIAAALRKDYVDVIITEQNRAIAAALFVRRVAARQLWFDTGFPFWSLRALDWTISPVMPATGLAPARTSPIMLRQTADTLRSASVDQQAIAAVRAEFPDDAFLLGVFVRLVKLDEQYLSFLGRLITADPRFRIIIAGPGDSGMVRDWLKRSGISGRATFVEGNVDLNVYGPAIDVMCDTFPFIGGLACREVAAHGTPVVSKLGTNWDAVLMSDRNPELLASSESEFIALVVRLATDPAFLARQRAVALEKAAEYSEPSRAVNDVEAAITASLVGTTPSTVGVVDRPVFVIGCGRSGTTMLFQMLKSHPSLQATTGHPDGEDHVGWIEHGGATIAGLYGNADTGDLGRLIGQPRCLHMGENDATEEARRSMHRYYSEEVLGGRVGKRVVNKCPHLSNKVGYVRSIFPDARFVHIVRDPVAMVASWVNIMGLLPNLAVYWPHVAHPCLWVYERTSEALQSLEAERIYPGQGLLLFADYWREINGNIPAEAEGFADQLLTVRYEDLIARPVETLRAITDFCGIDSFQSMPVQVDLTRNSARSILLSAEEVSEIRRITAPVATRYGYG